jgi:hypothetical protein
LAGARTSRILQVILQFCSLLELQDRRFGEMNVAAKAVTASTKVQRFADWMHA